MNRKRLSVFIIATLSLAIADAGITHYLLRNLGEGQELNPFVFTNNFFSILFSPIPVLLTGVYVWCLFYAERNHERFQDFINERSMKVGLFIFPIYFPLSKLAIIINNLHPLFGKSTPVVWLQAPFESWTDSPFMQLVFAETFILMLMFPILLYFAKRIYRVAPAEQVLSTSEP